MEFSYTLTEHGARIEPIGEPEALAVIPEEVGGVPVTELAPYVLSASPVEELYLPSGLRKIGAYAFYNCERLRYIRCFSGIRDLGAGLFAGAGRVERLDMVLVGKEKSCLKEMLSELVQTLRVRIYETEGGRGTEDRHGTESGRETGSGQEIKGRREARLIFPEFYEESIENTPARILVIETHGCGHRYRYCFYNTEFQYQAYDALFPQVQLQESEELATELAFGRVRYPLGLTEKYREMYVRYLREHWRTAGRLMIEADRRSGKEYGNIDPGELPWFVREILTDEAGAEKDGAEKAGAAETETDSSHGPQESAKEAGQTAPGMQEAPAAQVRELTRMAQEAGDTEAVVWLMDFAHELQAGLRVGYSRFQEENRRKPDGGSADGGSAAGKTDEGSVAGKTPVRKRRFEL